MGVFKINLQLLVSIASIHGNFLKFLTIQVPTKWVSSWLWTPSYHAWGNSEIGGHFCVKRLDPKTYLKDDR